MESTRIIGLDPSLVACGWGVIEVQGSKLRHIAHGVIRPPRKEPLPSRLSFLHLALIEVMSLYQPQEAGVEDMFMKDNAMSALKLGQARAACILAATGQGLNVGEYAPRLVKKSVVGTGTADKAQVAHMMNILLPGCGVKAGDAADALAIAVCHSHRVGSANSILRRAV
ncbi:crossover junction endodeoxyribonuclease RuvC [Litorimonas sp. RW-G-Af-16]|uniref:crossover junction endodeoxyribonuclease RuvC n=1 Tax=Litorimonas sp. RW-G-Af-16 TaxID=3241168 RepID=UPI00390C8B50